MEGAGEKESSDGPMKNHRQSDNNDTNHQIPPFNLFFYFIFTLFFCYEFISLTLIYALLGRCLLAPGLLRIIALIAVIAVGCCCLLLRFTVADGYRCWLLLFFAVCCCSLLLPFTVAVATLAV